MAKTQKVQIKSSEFQPKNEFILVQPEELQSEGVTESGIVFVTEHSPSDRPTSGTVIAVGKDIDDISEGDYIMWPNTDGIDLGFTDDDCVLLRYESVIGTKR